MTWAQKKAISIAEQETDGCRYVTYHKDFFPEFLTQLITEIAERGMEEAIRTVGQDMAGFAVTHSWFNLDGLLHDIRSNRWWEEQI